MNDRTPTDLQFSNSERSVKYPYCDVGNQGSQVEFYNLRLLNSETNKEQTMINKIQRPIRCHGGKRYLASWITEQMPPHLYFLEPLRRGLTADDHACLLDAIKGIKGKFLLRRYRSELYDETAERSGWRRADREIDCKASEAKENPKRVESLWMNY